MKRQTFYPTRQSEQAVWLENFRKKLPKEAAALGLEPKVVSDTVLDAGWLVYLLLTWLEGVRTHGKAATETLELAQTGSGDDPLKLPELTPEPLPEGVQPRPPGSLKRIFQLVADLRGKAACTSAIKAELGIDRPDEAGPDLDTLRPEITATVTAKGVRIDWGWQGHAKFLDQCEIHVDRGDGQGWRILTFDTTPGSIDNAPAPAVHTRWKYRAIYRIDDAQAGGWSEEASVSLGGA